MALTEGIFLETVHCHGNRDEAIGVNNIILVLRVDLGNNRQGNASLGLDTSVVSMLLHCFNDRKNTRIRQRWILRIANEIAECTTGFVLDINVAGMLQHGREDSFLASCLQKTFQVTTIGGCTDVLQEATAKPLNGGVVGMLQHNVDNFTNFFDWHYD